MSSIDTNFTQCSVDECEREARAPRGLCWAHYKRLIRHGHPKGGFRTFHGDALEWLRWAVEQETSACLPFPFKGASVYGVVTYAGESMIAPRAAAIIAHGHPPEGRIVTHSCRTKPCCNKRHIGWGTHDSNMKDRIRDSTNNAGEESAVAKLQNSDVLAIRARRGKEPQTATAAQFGISQTHVSEIQLRKVWKHI